MLSSLKPNTLSSSLLLLLSLFLFFLIERDRQSWWSEFFLPTYLSPSTTTAPESQIETLLEFYSCHNPFGINQSNEAQLLDLRQDLNQAHITSQIRSSIGQLRLATRKKYRYSQHLKRLDLAFDGINSIQIHGFINSLLMAHQPLNLNLIDLWSSSSITFFSFWLVFEILYLLDHIKLNCQSTSPKTNKQKKNVVVLTKD